MSNSYFQFKKFRVEQANAAMKVSTDACIQGAWSPIRPQVKSILDIGAGTGLLSLMLAQRSDVVTIDAVELDNGAAQQAEDNFTNSPWSDRLTILCADVRSMISTKLYDMIICNPPFFKNSLQGLVANRNMARHNDSLNYEDLLSAINRLLQLEGYASIMLPTIEFEQWESLLTTKGWYVNQKLLVKPRAGQLHNRVIGICSRIPSETIGMEELCIYKEEGYTDEFIALMSPFYLNL